MENIAKFLVDVEGTVLDEEGNHIPYKDTAGNYTIGIGHKMGKDDKRTSIDDREAVADLEKNIYKVDKFIDRYVVPELTEYQRDAIRSLAFNVGIGALKRSKALKNLNKGNIKGFLEEAFGSEKGFNKVTKGGKKVYSQGLANRRGKEAKLFLGEYNRELYAN